jgi:hypothetical protein
VEPRPPRGGVQDMWLKYLDKQLAGYRARRGEGPGLLPPAPPWLSSVQHEEETLLCAGF